jgi:hypothetical protein
LEVIMKMVFKVMAVDGVTSGEYAHKEEKGTQK